MKIEKDCIVEMDFHLTDKDGTVLDSSKGQEPLLYLHGKNQMLPALERELEGKFAEDGFTTIISPKEGYGVRSDEFVMEVGIDEFGDKGDEIQVGAQFIASGQGEERLATVIARDGDNVTVDLNHPLADVDLHFDIKVVSVRNATEEELAHGHVHGAGGHHHGGDECCGEHEYGDEGCCNH